MIIISKLIQSEKTKDRQQPNILLKIKHKQIGKHCSKVKSTKLIVKLQIISNHSMVDIHRSIQKDFQITSF